MARRTSIDRFTEGVCTIIFGAFAFLYLYMYQGRLLAAVQHYLSRGVTTYNYLVGAIIITVLLLLLSLLTATLVRRSFRFLPAIYHLPSCLALGVLTDFRLSTSPNVPTFGHSWVVAIALLVVLAIATMMMRGNFIRYKDPLQGLLANLFTLLVCLLLGVSMGNTTHADHQRLEETDYCFTASSALTQSVSSEKLVKKLLLST